ncbi:MAG: DUF677 domain-containing protein [Lachnospiraceae bacterium]|nr:DUF677 domain-containing protein [Lachnospiraceae bacterium]
MERTIREQFSDMAVVLSIKEPGTKGFASLYAEMLEFLNKLDGLYVILATDYMDKTRGLSVPLALKPNGQPSIYVFTDLELAKKWCHHYHHLMKDNKEPVGYLKSSDREFLHLFQTAYQLGIYKCIVNEGDRMLALNIADMIQINNLSQSSMVLDIKTIENYLKQNKIPKIMIRFHSVAVVDFEISKENKDYLNDVADKAFKEFSEIVNGFGGTVIKGCKHIENEGYKLATILFETKNDLLENIKNKNYLAIEKAFFESIEKYDTEKLFDNRYSYIRFEAKEQTTDVEE